jgi:acyl carrier protein
MLPGRYDRSTTQDNAKDPRMDSDAKTLNREIKQLIIDSLKIADITPDDIEDGAPIFGNPKLELDSLDAVELFVALQKRYGVKIDDQNLAKDVLQSVERIAEFVRANRTDQ